MAALSIMIRGGNMLSEMFVRCLECGEEHVAKDVMFVNIEEDIQGRDLLTYVCPVTQKETKAYVLRR